MERILRECLDKVSYKLRDSEIAHLSFAKVPAALPQVLRFHAAPMLEARPRPSIHVPPSCGKSYLLQLRTDIDTFLAISIEKIGRKLSIAIWVSGM